MVDEEVAIKLCATVVPWILSCGTRILLQRNEVIRGREALEKATSSSTASGPPSPLGKAKQTAKSKFEKQLDLKTGEVCQTF